MNIVSSGRLTLPACKNLLCFPRRHVIKRAEVLLTRNRIISILMHKYDNREIVDTVSGYFPEKVSHFSKDERAQQVTKGPKYS